MAVTAVTEEEGSEVEEAGISGETVAVVTGSGAAVVVAMATTEVDTNATSAKLLITEVPTCGLIRLAVTLLGWQWFLLAVSERDIDVWLVEISMNCKQSSIHKSYI